MSQTLEDTFIPECKEDGGYEDVQCFEHKGYGKQCWCVNEKGHEKKGTRAYGDEIPSCVHQGIEQCPIKTLFNNDILKYDDHLYIYP
jgi:hypothetical protein